MEAATSYENDCLVEVPIRLSLAEIERLTRIVDRVRQSGMVIIPPPHAISATTERLAAFAKCLLALRRKRDSALPGIEFGEPAWDMLLDLYVQHVEGKKVCVSSLCAAAAVPATTALRWIDAMVGSGLFIRSNDPQDRRRVHVDLAPALLAAIEIFLAEARERVQVALR